MYAHADSKKLLIGGRKPVSDDAKKSYNRMYTRVIDSDPEDMAMESASKLAEAPRAEHDGGFIQMISVLMRLKPLKRDEFLGTSTEGVKLPGAATVEEWQAFVEACDNLATVKCEYCDGIGHAHYKCPSRKKVDSIASGYKCGWVWGAIKGACYYDDYMKTP